jgi:hypothetical protein
VCHGPTHHHQRSPPPSMEQHSGRWDQIPAENRQQLLGFLSRLLERQLRHPTRPKEVRNDSIGQ